MLTILRFLGILGPPCYSPSGHCESGMAEFEAARVLERRLRKAAESCLDAQPRLFGED